MKQQPRHAKRKVFWNDFIQYCKDNDLTMSQVIRKLIKELRSELSGLKQKKKNIHMK